MVSLLPVAHGQCDLFSDSGGPDESLGFDLEIKNGRLLVSSRRTNGSGGYARVFRKDGNTWSLETELTVSNPDNDFGYSVALGPDDAFVGSPIGASAGSVFTFERSGTTWSPGLTILNPDQPLATNFGQAVGHNGQRLVVGADYEGSGKVYFYHRATAFWILEDEIEGTVAQSGYGEKVASSGNYAFVGAHLDGAGKVYVYRRNPSGNWVEEAILQGEGQGDYFGFGLDARMDRVIVGAPLYDDGPQTDAGRAYVYVRDCSGPSCTWVLESTLTPGSVTPDGTFFGISVSVDDDQAAVSLNSQSTDFAAYTYERTGSSWALKGELSVPAESAPGFLSVEGQDIAIGLPFNDGAAGDLFVGSTADLHAPETTISVSAGGTQNFCLNAGSSYAGATYLIMGTLSGTSPGTPFGSVHLPLNFDAFTTESIASANSGPYTTSLGALDSEGKGSAQFTIGANQFPVLTGLTAHHAYVILDSSNNVLYGSQAVPLTFLP